MSDDTLADFFRSQLTGDLQEIPGIGPAAAKCLAAGEDDDKITNSFQLIGKVRGVVSRGEASCKKRDETRLSCRLA